MEMGERELAIADWKKAADLGADIYIDILQEYGVIYTPKEKK
jgi:hypothetical protein